MRLRRMPLVLLAAIALPVSSASAAAAQEAAPTPPPAPSTPSPRASSCGVSVPAVVTTTGRAVTFEARMSGCPLGSTAGWRLVSPQGTDLGRVTIAGSRSVRVTIPAAHANELGTYRLTPVFGTDADYRQMMVASGRTILKAGSQLTASATPTSVTATASYYRPATQRQQPWPGATMTLERQTCRTTTSCTWTPVATARADAAGRATFPRPAASPAATGFRIVTTPTATVGNRSVAVAPR